MNNDPNQSSGNVFPTQGRFFSSYKKTINADQTLDDLSIVLPDNAIGVVVRLESDSILRINKGAAATANNGGIAQYDVMSFWDKKENLALLHFYTGAASIDVSFFIYVSGN